MHNFVQTTEVLCVLAFNQELAAISGQTAYTSGTKEQSDFSFKKKISYFPLSFKPLAQPGLLPSTPSPSSRD